ncbi:LysR family transcriptional regulator [Bradyrhizobium sp. DASA03076]|uniref:LysR family transcriptional regulator n=1 Tax=Bradyrhizobium sp. BLXBL-03 TaxID=3395916 RepID=UPI003F6E5F5C
MMDIRHLRYFVAVAEGLSFAKAARDLHMSQPPLSKRIADMEKELGVRLFDRSSKHVSLTAAGQALLPQARAAVEAFDSAMRVARATSPSKSRRLRISLPPDTSRSVLLDVVNQLRREDVEVHMTEATTAEQQQLLGAGEVDVAVLRHPFDARGLRISLSLGQTLGVVMHTDHPLAKREKLELPDLRPYPLVMFHRHLAPGVYDDILELCRAGGYDPPTVLHGVRTTAALLTSEQALTFTTERLLKRRGHAGSGELTWKPLGGSPLHWWTSAVCRSDSWDRLSRLAVSTILTSLQQHDGWVPMQRPDSKRPSTKRPGKSAGAGVAARGHLLTARGH